jgi:nucleotide-binding universal stress UspA family protein
MAIQIQQILLLSSGEQLSEQTQKISLALTKEFAAKLNFCHFGQSSSSSNFTGAGIDFQFEQLNDSFSATAAMRLIKKHNPDLVLLQLNENPKNGIDVKSVFSIIDHYERMVLTIPEKGNFNLSSIVVPIDTSFETRQKIPYALSMASIFNATIHVVGVSNDSDKDAEVTIKNYTRQVCNHIQEKGKSSTLDMRLGGNPSKQTLQYASEKEAGIVVIMSEQEGRFMDFFTGKYSEQIIKNSNIPILTVHSKDLVVSEARL